MRDTAIESSVVTKVKGFGRYANRVMDVSDYVTPPQVALHPRAAMWKQGAVGGAWTCLWRGEGNHPHLEC